MLIKLALQDIQTVLFFPAPYISPMAISYLMNVSQLIVRGLSRIGETVYR